jgi:Spy/CpxP family protein refolding chaperone
MKNSFAARTMLLSVAVILAFGAHIYAQPKADAKKGKAAEKAKETAVKGRLPMYFGKLELDEKQKQQIYVIQSTHDPKIDKLEDEIKALKDKRDSEIFDVLTKAQQKALTDLKDSPKGAAKMKEKADPKEK